MPCDVILTNRNGHPMTVPERPVLARERVRYVGEPVAFVVAETEMAARDGAEAVAVEYDDKPAVTDARAALCSDAPRLYESVPGNLLFDWALGDAGAVNAALARAARVVIRSIWSTTVLHRSPWSRAPPWGPGTLPLAV